jgi:hypothetical protein
MWAGLREALRAGMRAGVGAPETFPPRSCPAPALSRVRPIGKWVFHHRKLSPGRFRGQRDAIDVLLTSYYLLFFPPLRLGVFA